MNDTFQNLMRHATRLTRSGQLSEAMQAIQRALQGASQGAKARQAHSASTAPAAADPEAHLPGPSLVILDGCVFEVDEPAAGSPDAPSAPFAPSTPPTPPIAPTAPTPSTPFSHFTSFRPGAAPPYSGAAPAGETQGQFSQGDLTQGEFTEGSHTHASLTRRYKLYLPPGNAGRAGSCDRAGSSGKGLPLVVMLHGCTQNPDDFAAGTGMNALAREQGFCVLYPAQSADANPQRCWNWFKHNHQSRGRGEAALLASMTLSIMQQNGIDSRRVYIAGLSAGGAMAAIMAAAYPEIFAALGVHSGLAAGAASNVSEALAAMRSGAKSEKGAGLGGTRGHVGGGMSRATSGLKGDRPAGPDCAVPTIAVPAIIFHGDQDATVHPRNGEQVGEQAIAAVQGASGQSVTQRREQGVASGGRRFTRTVHQRNNDIDRDVDVDPDRDVADGADKGHHNTRSATLAEHWLVHGAGHAWSGGDAKGSYTDPKGPDASREMLRFFFEHPMPLQQRI